MIRALKFKKSYCVLISKTKANHTYIRVKPRNNKEQLKTEKPSRGKIGHLPRITIGVRAEFSLAMIYATKH